MPVTGTLTNTMSDTSMGQTLIILMWKHFIVRAKRFIHTPVEYLSPVFLFIILFSFKDNINPVQRYRFSQDYDLIQHTEPFTLDDITQQYAAGVVLYFPENNLTHLIMSKALESMDLRSADSKGHFNDLAAVEEYAQTMGPEDAVVIFENMDGPRMPKHLKYTIRTKDQFSTHMYKAMHENLEPHSGFGTIYYLFIRLQWAIDSTFIALRSGEPIKQTVSIQEFPFVKSQGSANIDVICRILTLTCFISLIMVFVFLMARLQEERISGIQELIKMVGVSTKTLGLSHFMNVLPGGLLFSIMGAGFLTIGPNPLITNSNPVIIGMMLFFYFVSIVSLAFAFSYATKISQYVVSLAVFVYVTLWMPAHLIYGVHMDRKLVMLTGLLPHVPMAWFWDEVKILEQYGYGVTLSTMFTSHTVLTASVFVSFLFMLLQAAICFTLAWYLSLVCPGQYGNALPWNFFVPDCVRNCKKYRDVEGEPQEREKITAETKYFEEPPSNSEAGIEISNVSKVFDGQRVLNKVSFNVYKGDITVLLGHNGAGKTTLMSIITGMISASEGTVRVNGKDTASYKNDVRKQLGFCPQHNLFFPDLTVLEHVKFFSMLKNVPWAKVTSSSKDLLEKLELGEKFNVLSTKLSGGMKRRLQLACALAGDATVLILDEPTSGLDIETRRGLWNLLLTLRADKAVLLSTHFMEEADALGDRVAALHRGELRCCATPMHLKKEIDTGYRLSFTLHDSGKTDLEKEAHMRNIEQIIIGFVPKATQLNESGQNTISFSLPSKDSSQFPKLFAELESKMDVLGIQSIGVGSSTLEEVFMRLCSDASAINLDDEIDSGITDITSEMKPKARGICLYARQFWALTKRQFHFIMSKKYAFLLLQVILPILMICIFTKTLNGPKIEDTPKNPPMNMNMDMYKESDKRALANINLGEAKNVLATFPQYEPSPDVSESLIEIAKQDKLEYNKYIFGIEINDTDAKALYTTLVRHAAPVAMNALSNAIAAITLEDADGDLITTTNYPVDDNRETYTLKQPKDAILAIMWGVIISFLIQATCVNTVTLPCTERLSGTRHLHVMAGCPPALHWLATLLVNAALAGALLVLPAALAARYLDSDATFTTHTMAGAFVLVLVLGSVAFLAFSFFISFGFADRAATGILIAVIIIFGFITPLVKTASDMVTEHPSKDVWYYLLLVVEYTVPSNTFSVAAMKIANVARLNAYCHLNRDKCPVLVVPEKGFDAHKCCTLNMEPRSYYSFDDFSPAFGMVYLAVQSIVYMILVLLAQRGVFNMLSDKLFNCRYTPEEKTAQDTLEKEKAYVKEHIKKINSAIKDTLLVSSVHKRYRSLFGKACAAVKGICFSIRKGECFGLVGVNGAGKSTTFKMLTCEEFPTRGSIVNNNHLQGYYDNDKYLQALTYCPQFCGLDYFLTGRQNLALMLTLNGLSKEDVQKETDVWLKLVDLTKYADKPVSTYSGGSARRLGTAAALLRRAPLALLDEPTAGVDVAARRHVWRAIRARGASRAVLITSHSMDEMEVLCSRIGIMSDGLIKALDSPAALRAAHAAGHAVAIKLRPHHAAAAAAAAGSDAVDGVSSNVNNLKKICFEMQWTLTDNHETMLHYHIRKDMKMTYSDLFAKLEHLKVQFEDLIEDYIVTETTLEQVFLSYAKMPNAETPNAETPNAETSNFRLV